MDLVALVSIILVIVGVVLFLILSASAWWFGSSPPKQKIISLDESPPLSSSATTLHPLSSTWNTRPETRFYDTDSNGSTVRPNSLSNPSSSPLFSIRTPFSSATASTKSCLDPAFFVPGLTRSEQA